MFCAALKTRALRGEFRFRAATNQSRFLLLWGWRRYQLRSPVAGIVINAAQGNVGRIAIRDANGFSHQILHTHSQHVTVGDPVAAGQFIGTLGNTGTKDQHVHLICQRLVTAFL